MESRLSGTPHGTFTGIPLQFALPCKVGDCSIIIQFTCQETIMTQEKTRPPVDPYIPDPTKVSRPIRRDPASDLPTDPPRHEKDHPHGKPGSGSKKGENHSSEPGTHSTHSGTTAKPAKASRQSHKNK
jgi:hypothetical protein